MKNPFSSLRRNHSAPDLQVREALPAAPQATVAIAVPGNDKCAARLWNSLQQSKPAQPPRYYSVDDVPWNDSGVQCVCNNDCLHVQTGKDPQSRVPMHAHVLPLSENTPAETPRYAAAQAPAGSKDAWTRMVIHALESGQGIFQFVSPQAHRNAASPRAQNKVGRKHPSILEELQQAMAMGNEPINLQLGDRFALIRVTNVVTEDGNNDHVQYLIEAEDLPGATAPRKYAYMHTQVGLPFENAVLTPDAIVRASELLDAHQRKTGNIPSDHRTPVQDASQLIVSHAGIGRNAALIVYRDIRSKIDAGMVNRANLDETLYRIIAAYRAIRGPRFIHSAPQLAALRAALWLQCPATPKLSLADRARRLFSIRQSSPSPAVGAEISTDTSASPANSPRYAATLKRSRSTPSTPTGWRRRPPAPQYVAVPSPLPGGAAVAQAAGTPALPNGFDQKIDDGKYRFHDADKTNGHYSNFWQGQPVVIDRHEYRTVEHYFQAQKYPNAPSIRQKIVAAETADGTKNVANNKDNRRFAVPWGTWKTARIGVMYTGVYAKFSQDADLKAMLLATDDAWLIETMPKTRDDTFWGVRDGIGTNMLGQILMRVREDIRQNRPPDLHENFDPKPKHDWRTSP